MLDLTLLCCRNAFAVAGHDGMVSWTAERSRTHHSFSLPQEPTALALPAQQATGYELRAAQMAVAAEEGDTDGLAALVEEDQTMLHAVRLGSAIEIGTPRLTCFARSGSTWTGWARSCLPCGWRRRPVTRLPWRGCCSRGRTEGRPGRTAGRRSTSLALRATTRRCGIFSRTKASRCPPERRAGGRRPTARQRSASWNACAWCCTRGGGGASQPSQMR